MTAEESRQQAKEAGLAAADQVSANAKPHRSALRVLGAIVALLVVATAIQWAVVISTKAAQSADSKARLDCQASVVRNIATQTDITADTGAQYRQYLTDMNGQEKRQAASLKALGSATTHDEAQAAFDEYQAASDEKVRLTDAYIAASQRAADLKAQTPVVFQC